MNTILPGLEIWFLYRVFKILENNLQKSVFLFGSNYRMLYICSIIIKTKEIMTIQEMNNKLRERAKELLTIPQVQKEYKSKENEAESKDWILHQALITLIYSHEERVEMLKKK